MKELKQGVYLYSQEEIIEEQKEWNEFDHSKQFDFTTHKFWLTTDSGDMPSGFNDLNEVYKDNNND